MQIFFQNPVFWLLAVAAIPALVHLLARTRPRERPFSSVYFLKQVIQRQTRVNKPTDWLLLLLRTIALACLAAAFLLPFIDQSRHELHAGARSVILIVDRSASMAAHDGQQTRIGKAGAAAENIVTSLKASDKVNLIWVDALSEPVFREPSSNKSLIVREIRQIRSKPEHAAVEAALKHAADQLAQENDAYRKEVYVISDFQASNWADLKRLQELFADHYGVQYLTVAQTPCLPNTAVTGLTIHPAVALPGQQVSIQARIDNFGQRGARTTVHLEAGDLRTSEPCEIPARSFRIVSFTATAPASPGQWVVTAGIDHDAFPDDDTRSTIGYVTDRIKCDVITTDRKQAGYLASAFESLPFLQTQVGPGLGAGQPDIIVWNKPSPEDEAEIRKLSAAGATVIIVPDFSGDKLPSLILCDTPGAAQFEFASDEKGWKLEARRGNDPAFSLFRHAEMADPLEGSTYRRLNEGLTGTLPDTCEVIVQYTDGVPAIIRRHLGRGIVILWNVPVTWQDSTWGHARNFLPFVGEFILHSRANPSGYIEPQSGVDLLTLKLPEGLHATDVSLIKNGGEQIPVANSNTPSATISLATELPATPGLYTWMAHSKPLQYEAVNLPSTESDLIIVKDGDMPPGSIAAADSEGVVAIVARVPLWPWLLALAVICLILETSIASRLAAAPSKTADNNGKEDTP